MISCVQMMMSHADVIKGTGDGIQMCGALIMLEGLTES